VKVKCDEHIATLAKIDPWDMFEIVVVKWKKISTFVIIATLALGLWPRQGFAKVCAKTKPESAKIVWGNELSHSQVNSHFGNWSPNELPKEKAIARVKSH
jgi:hypothetical protein